MATDTLTVKVSGKSYYAALDPMCSDVPAQEGFATARSIRPRGRGVTVTYVLPRPIIAAMESHLRLVGESFIVGEDADTRAEGRACLRDAARIAAALKVTT